MPGHCIIGIWNHTGEKSGSSQQDFRAAGYLGLKVDLNREYLDPGQSRLLVSDHQIAHIYIKNPTDIPAVKRLFEEKPGVEQVLDEEGKRAYGLNHERSGELVLISESDSWFTYYFWEDDRKGT